MSRKKYFITGVARHMDECSFFFIGIFDKNFSIQGKKKYNNFYYEFLIGLLSCDPEYLLYGGHSVQDLLNAIRPQGGHVLGNCKLLDCIGIRGL